MRKKHIALKKKFKKENKFIQKKKLIGPKCFLTY